ncbi:Protein PTI1 [Meyerozyma sp. JA9]|nr:Protein PTI1 [Meyerozyma sp. JA9]
MSRQGPFVGSTILFVGSIPFDWDESTLKSVVAGSGNIVDVRLGFDFAGKNKGYGFVEYQNAQEAQKGLGLLSQIMIYQPNGQPKRLRVELSKEGLRSGSNQEKAPLPLDRSRLPNNVQLPPDMLFNANHTPPPTSQNSLPPSLPQAPSASFTGSPMPPHLLSANSTLPPFPNGVSPFEIPDKISDTLSKIPPAQLIELISNLKTILTGPNAARAADVFQLSPHLASSAAQALLLMGFIDSDVIAESMKSTQVKQEPRANFSNPPQAPVQDSRWPHLPPQTVQKLKSMAPDQADLIAQVLSIPQDQINAFPPDKQTMVLQLRSQYL